MPPTKAATMEEAALIATKKKTAPERKDALYSQIIETREKPKEMSAVTRPIVKFIITCPTYRMIVTHVSSSRRPPTPSSMSHQVMRFAMSLPAWYAFQKRSRTSSTPYVDQMPTWPLASEMSALRSRSAPSSSRLTSASSALRSGTSRAYGSRQRQPHTCTSSRRRWARITSSCSTRASCEKIACCMSSEYCCSACGVGVSPLQKKSA
mmetsp:Transcript_36147/g.62047  ORF Transcript_36147/g.62047 Transcript_36147/m.62047 type:complete len:208 (-) Transcript_36147:135-758(-)